MHLRDPAHLVSPRAVVYWTVRAVPLWVLVLVGESIWLWSSGDHLALRVAALVVTVLLAAAHLIVMPRWRYRVHRWELTDDAVYTRTGWWTQESRVAPLSRVQTVDTERGPIGRLFHLTKVTVTTASAAGPLVIDGLDDDVGSNLTAAVTAAAQAVRDDAT